MYRIGTMVVLLLVFVISVSSIAQQGVEGKNQGPDGHRQNPEKMFEGLDADGDGNISQAEAPELMKQRWQQIDTNGDGSIDQSEQEAFITKYKRYAGDGTEPFRPGAPMDPDKMFERLDFNGDGIITKDEAPPHLVQRWPAMDTNGDGKLDKAEQNAVIDRFKGSSSRTRVKEPTPPAMAEPGPPARSETEPPSETESEPVAEESASDEEAKQ